MPGRPLFWSAVVFAAGLALPADDLAAGCWGAVSIVLLAGAVILCACAGSTAGLRAAFLALLAGYLCAGRVALAGSALQAPDAIARLQARHPRLFEGGVTLEGILARQPALIPGQAGLPDEREWLIDLRCVLLRRMRLPASGRVRLRSPIDGDAAAPARTAPPPRAANIRRGP